MWGEGGGVASGCTSRDGGGRGAVKDFEKQQEEGEGK